MADSQFAKFTEHEVVPDVLASVPEDIQTLQVDYGHGHKVDGGNELTPTQVQNKPKVSWNADSEALYTVVMTDPDAPSRKNPIRREWKHWLVINVPGDNVAKGHELAAYVGAGPPQGTGLHRYVLLVYKQTSKITDSTSVPNNSTSGRPSFRIAKFAEEHGLQGPIAGNFFQAQYDDHVPVLHRSFKN